jgi:hypothetical protein
MGFLSKLVGGGVVDAATGIANIVDKFVETPDERKAADLLLAKMAQKPAELQVELNKIEAGHRTIFVAGWRPFIGWICGLGLAYAFLIHPTVDLWYDGEMPALPTDIMLELVIAMLGLAGLRSAEKVMGKSK